mgnify:CR=1 FL=1
MASAPKTYQAARATYGASGELVWWVFMRISGLLLVFLVFGHLFFNNIQIDAGTIDFAYVANRLSQPGVKIYDTFLLAFAMLHGINGLRYSIEDHVRKPGRRFWTKVVVFSIAGIVFVLGTMTLWAFSYDEMGAAVRALD